MDMVSFFLFYLTMECCGFDYFDDFMRDMPFPDDSSVFGKDKRRRES